MWLKLTGRKEIVAIVARLDPHKPANTQISTVHSLSQACCYLDDDGSQQSFFEFSLFGVMTFWLVAQTGQIRVNTGRLIWIALVKSFPTIPIDLG